MKNTFDCRKMRLNKSRRFSLREKLNNGIANVVFSRTREYPSVKSRVSVNVSENFRLAAKFYFSRRK